MAVVGIEDNGYGGLAEHLGDYREVNVAGEEQGGARVPKVVEARVSAGRRARVTLAVKNYEQNVLRAATVQQPTSIS